ncbi:MAG: T9SS type B sorting domain-containing protein [Bacteroidales bacterium]
MILKKICVVLVLTGTLFPGVWCQADNDPPDSPVLRFVTVQPETGFIEIYWTKSLSPDVSGYVLYDFKNGEGFAFDTIYNPAAIGYIFTRLDSRERAVAFVVASIDTAGNVSPLSNSLTTMFINASADTCRSTISITWNHYNSVPDKVTEYRVLVSENGNDYYEGGIINAGSNTFTLNNIRNGVTYCLLVEAVLEGGLKSSSNKICVNIKMQRAPEWINADYATVDDNGKILLSFTVDPQSEIRNFRLERKELSQTEYTVINDFTVSGNNLKYTDDTPDITKRYLYRLAAINNCGIASVYSNPATNIVVNIFFSSNVLKISWNPYSGWLGGIAVQSIQANFGKGFNELSSLHPDDSLIIINYADIMYNVSGSEICFYITADEIPNSRGISGSSRSNIVCIESEERFFVPNTFTPDEDNINDLFRPVFSFVPVTYLLVITDRNNNILYESTDYEASWDGKKNGRQLPSGVYLWYLKISSPSGKKIEKSGTVTIIRNM